MVKQKIKLTVWNDYMQLHTVIDRGQCLSSYAASGVVPSALLLN